MASNQRTVDFLLDQLSAAGDVTAKKMSSKPLRRA